MWSMRVIRSCCGKSPNPASYSTPLTARKYTIVASNINIFINKPKQQILSTPSIQTNFLTRNISLFGSKNEISTTYSEKELDFTNYTETNVTDPTISLDPPIVEGIPQTFADLGLGGWDLPHHWVQSILEYLNVTMGVPWIPAIAVATLTLRLLAIPAYISMRGFVARSHNSQPEQLRLQAAARKATTQIEKQKRMLEYMTYMRNHNINPLKALLYQLPIGLTFISFFSALRGMTQAKVPSLVEGGVSWFTDLTVSDPYFILPTLSCVSLFLLFRFGGAASEVGPMAEMPYMRKILLYSPFVMLPFLLPQPSVMFIFWITSNIFSFTLLQLFKQPGVERYFGIPEKMRHPQAVMDEMQDMMNPIKMRNKVLQEQRAAEDAKIKVKKHLEEMRKFSQDSKKR